MYSKILTVLFSKRTVTNSVYYIWQNIDSIIFKPDGYKFSILCIIILLFKNNNNGLFSKPKLRSLSPNPDWETITSTI